LIAIASLLIIGCAYRATKTRIPEFIENLEKLSMSDEQRKEVGKILQYTNQLEHDAR
jgi:hypothetical protein